MKASVRQDILLAVVIVEIRVEARHEGIDDTRFETRGRRMRERERAEGEEKERKSEEKRRERNDGGKVTGKKRWRRGREERPSMMFIRV